MKLSIVAFMTLTILAGCQAGNQTRPSPSDNGLAIYGLIFGIKKDKAGDIEAVRLARVEDVRTKSPIQFELSASLMEQAETKIKKQHQGIDEYLESGKESFVICIYTNIDPDVVKCGEE